MERIKILESQIELLSLKLNDVIASNRAYRLTLDRVAIELGVPKEELSKWEISKDGNYLEKRRVKETTVRKRKK